MESLGRLRGGSALAATGTVAADVYFLTGEIESLVKSITLEEAELPEVDAEDVLVVAASRPLWAVGAIEPEVGPGGGRGVGTTGGAKGASCAALGEEAGTAGTAKSGRGVCRVCV